MIHSQDRSNRTFVSFPVSRPALFKKQLLQWASRFEVCCFLDNHQYSLHYHSYECIAGIGARNFVRSDAGSAFAQLKQFCNGVNDYVFGHFGYDLKNELEYLDSSHPDDIHFPDLFFFIPEIVIFLNESEISIGSTTGNEAAIFQEILQATLVAGTSVAVANIQSRFSQEEYTGTVDLLKQHIQKGDCYEINFCQEFFAENTVIDPVQCYLSLSSHSPNPFGAYYKCHEKHLCCASPERYIRKEGSAIISQPVKGTSTRNAQSAAADALSKRDLLLSSKERSENVMIVDLVRNDLSKICREGSVKVDELYGIYSFPQVHQMISTVSGLVIPGLHWAEIIRATFPMGSMTGAPKKRVMELIETYEKTRRGIFSGALGYVTPSGDFDFNVVIRSILYNQHKRYLSYLVGSGITFYSDPEKEYEECMLKAAAIKKVLS